MKFPSGRWKFHALFLVSLDKIESVMENYIVGLGEVLWDVLPTGKQLGGAPANFAYHVKRLGLPAKVVSAIGNDELGDEIRSLFGQRGIDSYLERGNYPTGTVQVTLDKVGVPSYEIKMGVAWDYIPFTSEMEELAAHTQVVCFGSLAQRNVVSRVTIHRFLDAMPGGDNVLKIFDINLRQHFYSKEILDESLCKCNVLKINDEELSVVDELFGLQGATAEGKCRQLLSLYQLQLPTLTFGCRPLKPKQLVNDR